MSVLFRAGCDYSVNRWREADHTGWCAARGQFQDNAHLSIVRPYKMLTQYCSWTGDFQDYSTSIVLETFLAEICGYTSFCVVLHGAHKMYQSLLWGISK